MGMQLKAESSEASANPFLHDESSCTGRFTTDVSVEEAASLLQKVAHLASAELRHDVDHSAIDGLTTRQIDSTPFSSPETYPNKDSSALCERRLRTVSISSQSVSSPICTPRVLSVVPSPLSPPPMTLYSPTVPCITPLRHPVLRAITRLPTAPKHALRFPSVCNLGPALRHVQHSASSSEIDMELQRRPKYVGSTTPHKLKGILRHKFSWKKHPEVRIHI